MPGRRFVILIALASLALLGLAAWHHGGLPPPGPEEPAKPPVGNMSDQAPPTPPKEKRYLFANGGDVPGRYAGLLEEQGFAVIPARIMDPASYYEGLRKAGKPIFITGDSALYTVHVVFDSLLADVEEEELAPRLARLLRGLAARMDEEYRSGSGDLRAAAALAVAYVSVPLKVLDPGYRVPGYAADKVSAELALIERAEGMAASPLMGYRVDYTQFKPRGHYTRSETLERYFKAMMWLGRMRFEASDSSSQERARIQTLAALLIAHALEADRGLMEAWRGVYEPISYLVGPSDDPTPLDYVRLAEEVYGGLDPERLADPVLLERFMEAAAEMKPRITGAPVYEWERESLAGMKLMGQRFTLDGYILGKLCHPTVRERFRVSGLDVPAAMGSDLALSLLRGDAEKYPDYMPVMKKLRREIGGLDEDYWGSTFYTEYLYALKALLGEAPEGAPAYMRGREWRLRELNTYLAGWALLKHDTILYAKQPYAGLTSIPQEREAPGYVEPLPELYSRLRRGVEKLGVLSRWGLLDEEWSSRLGALEDMLGRLEEISLRELRGGGPAPRDMGFIRGYGSTLKYIIGGLESDPRLVADVYTDPNTMHVLEVATGYFDELVAVFPYEGKSYAGFGVVMSYYEFYWPASGRLTDGEWRAMVEGGEAPPRPRFTAEYMGGQ